ncbi:hypothetical protein J8C06_07740 [Chloracidobacterium validum]|uniref:Uncharacterized protein n=1 Tax=Chloracidobacterium validum TaxID=2821543 RepID=A0ABX8B6J1_9BACT|nr:hypothetical protein [Chloracidobacterium validum]QUW02251.1 hypothetical protein J8C06_07740 [Chloracidobacterium validum]
MNQTHKTIVVGGLFVGSLALLLYVWFSDGTSSSGGVAPLRPGLIRATDLEQGTAPTKEVIASQPTVADGLLVRMARVTLTPARPRSVPEATRNIFDYPPPPPPKPVPPPPPPPITLQSLSPQRVFARSTLSYELLVQGQPLPEGARVILDGQLVASERTSDNQLRVRLTPDLTANARNATVRVIVPGQATKWYSNDLTLMVEAPPNPNDQYRYIGLVTDAGGQNPRAILATDTEYQTVRPSEPIGRFRVKTITRDQVVLEDTQLPGVSHTMPLSSGPPLAGGVPPVSGYPQPPQPVYQAPQGYQLQPQYNPGQPVTSDPNLTVKPQEGNVGMPVIVGEPGVLKPVDGQGRPQRPFNRQRPPNQ